MSEEAGMSSGCGEEGTVSGLGKDWGRQATWGRQGLGAAVEEVGAGGGRGNTDVGQQRWGRKVVAPLRVASLCRAGSSTWIRWEGRVGIRLALQTSASAAFMDLSM